LMSGDTQKRQEIIQFGEMVTKLRQGYAFTQSLNTHIADEAVTEATGN
jgi:hypothetical protein